MFAECWIEDKAIGTGVERSGTEVPIAARRSCCQLFVEDLNRTFVAERSHYFVVAPFKVFFQFFIQFINAAECFPIIKIPLVIPVASFHFTVMPRRSRRYQFVLDMQLL